MQNSVDFILRFSQFEHSIHRKTATISLQKFRKKRAPKIPARHKNNMIFLLRTNFFFFF